MFVFVVSHKHNLCLRFSNYFGISVAEQKCRFLKYGTHADVRDDVGEECIFPVTSRCVTTTEILLFIVQLQN